MMWPKLRVRILRRTEDSIEFPGGMTKHWGILVATCGADEALIKFTEDGEQKVKLFRSEDIELLDDIQRL